MTPWHTYSLLPDLAEGVVMPQAAPLVWVYWGYVQPAMECGMTFVMSDAGFV